jgi:hypothetical protein
MKVNDKILSPVALNSGTAPIIYSVNYAFRAPKLSLESVDEIKISTPAGTRTQIL